MSLWIELHCDILDMDTKIPTGELACWTHRNASEGAVTGNSAEQVRATVRHLTARAKANGWTRTRAGWCCPHCATVAAQR